MDENKYFKFLKDHWSKLLLGFLAFASVAAWGERLWRSHKTQSNQDYSLATHIFASFQKGEPLSSEAIESAESILKKHPELHPKYDSKIALSLFSQKHEEKAIPYVQASLERAGEKLSPPFREYTLGSCLIGEKNYQEAFERAEILHSQLDEQYKTLSALNLLRLVVLSRKLAQSEKQNMYWEELKKHPVYPSLASLFEEGEISLESWIASNN
ncbi:MAG: hypothetical protein K940chlam9_01490 [Chlamydiae bacterium]|nr:hypothetical protein [Chlamydiota bacterium]